MFSKAGREVFKGWIQDNPEKMSDWGGTLHQGTKRAAGRVGSAGRTAKSRRREVSARGGARVRAAERGQVRSQALVRWGGAAGPQRCPVGAEAAASSAAPRCSGVPARWRRRWRCRCPGSRTLAARAAQWAERRPRSGDLGAGLRRVGAWEGGAARAPGHAGARGGGLSGLQLGPSDPMGLGPRPVRREEGDTLGSPRGFTVGPPPPPAWGTQVERQDLPRSVPPGV